MLRLVKFFFLLLVALAGAVFAYNNPGDVSVSYYFGELTLPLGILIFILLGLGVLMGVLGSLLMFIGIRRENRRLKRQIGLAQQEVANLRSIPLQDR